MRRIRIGDEYLDVPEPEKVEEKAAPEPVVAPKPVKAAPKPVAKEAPKPMPKEEPKPAPVVKDIEPV
jgi:hypothetical protein